MATRNFAQLHELITKFGAEAVKLEDGDHESLLQGFAFLEQGGAGLQLGTLMGVLLIHECDNCKKKWINQPLLSMPPWKAETYGRGRPVELTKVRELLSSVGWEQQSKCFCEPCLLERATRCADGLLNLDNKNIRAFLKVYLRAVEHQKTGIHNYMDDYRYRFNVKFITYIFGNFPAKRRKAFSDMAKVMSVLEIL